MAAVRALSKRKILSLILAIPLFLYAYNIVSARNKNDTRTNGKLIVNFNVPLGHPIFDFDDFKPGDCAEHTVTVKNKYSENKDIFIKSIKKKDEEKISQAFPILISNESDIIYGESPPKSLYDFYVEGHHKGIFLQTLSANQQKDYTIQICFDKDAGNKYQKKETKFDIVIYTDYTHEMPDEPDEIPAECLAMETTRTIYGTSKGDIIMGTNQSEIIVAKDGDDIIAGGGGNDCIVGGNGDDIVLAGDGDDIVFGQSGNDKIDGGSGNDKLWGGKGDDILIGGFGDDYLNGETGKDWLTGQLGYDTCIEGEKTFMCEN